MTIYYFIDKCTWSSQNYGFTMRSDLFTLGDILYTATNSPTSEWIVPNTHDC
jgi:hypothetical protein